MSEIWGKKVKIARIKVTTFIYFYPMAEKKKQASTDLMFVSFNVSKKLLFYSLTFNNYLLF